MFVAILAFFAGDLLLQKFSFIPNAMHLVMLIPLVVIVCSVFWKYRKIVLVTLFFIFGFDYSSWYVHQHLDWMLPKKYENKPVLVSGYVVSIPQLTRWNSDFYFMLDRLAENKAHALIHLSMQATSKRMIVGDKWLFLVRLKQIHGLRNPGGFDYEAWSAQRGLRATGYVVQNQKNHLLSHHWYYQPIDHFRQKIQLKLKPILPVDPRANWLLALIIGERHGVPVQDWQILRKTGTNHLMAVAGLHIGMLAACAHFLVHLVWRRSSTLLLFVPVQIASMASAVLVGITYSFLAGFSVPTQRACVMLCVVAMILLLRRKILAWHVWGLALWFVLLFNPLSVLTESFWLSFVTIALIIYGMRGRLAASGWWWKWGRVQWVIGVGLIPLTLLLFQQASILGFIANCIAIPWLGCLVLPFCLLSLAFLWPLPMIAKWCLLLANFFLAILWTLLGFISELPAAVWSQSIVNDTQAICGMIGVTLMLMPNGFPGRWLSILWLLFVFVYPASRPQKGEFWLTLLDVGQGLSAVVQTHSHVLIFDTGARFGDRMNMGESVVLPFLAHYQWQKIDMLIISHGDNDHIGGADIILHTLPVKLILTSVPNKLLPMHSHLCLSGMQWDWDDVNFKIIYPYYGKLSRGNDSSCVLKISNNHSSILLTGDIEKLAEQDILSTTKSDLLHTTVLIAPHHGSKTSGLTEFVNTVRPTWVLYPVGYENRYHFPHFSVTQAYKNLGAKQLATSVSGAITFKIRLDNELVLPELYRFDHIKYYNHLTTLEI